jgi:hypothetical protein
VVSLASELLVQVLLLVFVDPHNVYGVILVQVEERLNLFFQEAGSASCCEKDEAVVGAAFAADTLCAVPLIRKLQEI